MRTLLTDSLVKLYVYIDNIILFHFILEFGILINMVSRIDKFIILFHFFFYLITSSILLIKVVLI